jgi:hypothetical protein
MTTSGVASTTELRRGRARLSSLELLERTRALQAATDTEARALRGFSLVTGGPFYRLLCRLRLVRAGDFRAKLPALAVLALTWGMLAVVAGVERVVTPEVDPVLIEYAVVGRLWFAIPLFFVAESELHQRMSQTMTHLERGDLVDGASLPELERVLRRAERWRDTWIVEYGLFVVAIGLGVSTVMNPGHNLGWLQDATPRVRTPDRVWYTLVAMPVFQFLLARWLWRWALWSYVVARMSRLRLRLVTTHPDRAGGVALLANPTYAFSIFFAGVSSALAGTWSTQVEHWRTSINAYLAPFVLLGVVGNVLAFGALTLFFRPLRRARFDGLREYGQLALVHNRLFHARWVDGKTDELLGTPDISSLADLQSAHDCMSQTRLVPYGTRELIVLGACTAAPMLPAIGLAISFKELLLKIVHALFSSLPG